MWDTTREQHRLGGVGADPEHDIDQELTTDEDLVEGVVVVAHVHTQTRRSHLVEFVAFGDHAQHSGPRPAKQHGDLGGRTIRPDDRLYGEIEALRHQHVVYGRDEKVQRKDAKGLEKAAERKAVPLVLQHNFEWFAAEYRVVVGVTDGLRGTATDDTAWDTLRCKTR
eukprot:7182705-Prymnesium_polylepis.1